MYKVPVWQTSVITSLAIIEETERVLTGHIQRQGFLQVLSRQEYEYTLGWFFL